MLPHGSTSVTAGRRPRIAVDMDEVIADSDAKLLRLYNQLFAADLTPADLAGRELEQVVPPERAPVVRQLQFDPAFFADVPVIAGSRAVLPALAAEYEIFIATAAMEIPTSFAAKFGWLRRHFPCIPPSHVVFCGDKSVLDVDYLIDDSPRHFLRFRGQPVLFSSRHNLGREHDRYLRVNDWAQVRALFLQRHSRR